MAAAIPIIDLAAMREGEAGLDAVAKKIGAACRDVGFFYVVNHGVDAELLAETFAQSKRFFALPLATKQEIAIEKVGGNRGYIAVLHEALDPAQGADMKESFNVGLELAPDDPEILARAPFRSLNAWPNVEGFRATVLAYYEACSTLAARLHRAFACDLGLDLDFFADKFRRPMETLRLLHYPAAPSTGEPSRAGAHTDYGNLTLLATDDVGGLEVRARSGEWLSAPVVEGAFVVNIGDCLMRWTNDVYVSTPHRVINRSPRARYSVAFFCDADPEAWVAAIPSCVPDGEAPRHPPLTAGEHLSQRLYASKPAGM
jgi:isopenicillin N synthase-like dioxygenase